MGARLDTARLSEALGDRYRLDRLIGEGGMATVHLAEDRKHGREVALKVLRPELALASDRFLKEIRVTAGLQHPGIVPLYDSGDAGGLLFYVMPWIQGESLRDRLDRDGPIALDESLRILQTVSNALHYAHEQGVVHRDIKPSNILLGPHGTVFVADFGVAHAVLAAGDQKLTSVGHSVGTPSYMSPEQASGDETVDARSDIYALGAMAFEMLSGTPPFSGSSTAGLLVKKLTEAPPTLSGFPPAVQRMVQRALQTQPSERQASARELAETATTLLAGTSREPARAPEGPPAIIVLPFRNLSPDPDNAYFADGLAEEILSDLAQLDALRVISRTTAMQYRDSGKAIPELAAELAVHYALEGSVRKAGNAIRATVQLVEAATDRQLWSSKFNGTLDDVFEIQERVSTQVVAALEVSLSAKDVERLSKRREEDPRALELIMKVQYETWRVTPEAMRRAEAMLDQADDLVQGSPRLMAMKANLLFQTVNFGFSTDEDRITEARRLAEVAIAEDPECAPAYSALAWIHLGRLRQAAEGVEYAERAYELDPSDTAARIALVVLPLLLGISRRVDPAEVHQRMVREDPLFPAIHAAASVYTASRGLWEASLELIDRSLELEWNGSFRVTRAFALLQFDRRAEAEATLARDLDEKGPMAGLARALYHALRGDRPRALAALDEEVFAWARPDGEYAWHLARTYTILEDPVEALRWLDRAVDGAFWNWRLLGEYDRVLAPLRDEPEFERIVDRSRRMQQKLAERWGRSPA